jgi:hypothetical protein
LEIQASRDGKTKVVSVERSLLNLAQRKAKVFAHQAQVQVQRAEVTKIWELLNFDPALVVIDFVGHYTSSNEKMYQLVFVVHYRKPSGYEDWRYHNIWSKRKARAPFVITAWKMLFAKKVFDNYKEIFLSRDNGGHFCNYKVIKYMSEIGHPHEKIFRIRSYAPNHGYSIADRHAAQIKGCIRRAAATGKLFIQAMIMLIFSMWKKKDKHRTILKNLISPIIFKQKIKQIGMESALFVTLTSV